MNEEARSRYDLMKELDEVFREVRKLIMAEWNRNNIHGLNMTHGRMLIIISESGEIRSSELAEKLSITNGGVTGLADRLIELGFVKRERSEQDRRAVRLMLTDEGKAIIGEMMKTRERVMMKLFDNLTEESMITGIELFRQMSRNMTEPEE
ncbi:MarR family transcriptional regulator [Paenibacillus sp. LHD-117]|uniref:MarR family winged helix-turn-helix transcriptional regulator n=1 Tax=Paenibacillus sp. LHD-117 TaxID=3071412 RepID=UPI0027E215F7|nr:MarR family transcriptional regulator [Paenibacillus sp. LHD-117]MDQ6418547.1 MarR family transcriptional regulator [Paenibacillus sp. LHD-117]